MTRVPAPSQNSASCDDDIDVAISQLIRLIAKQAARENGSDAPNKEERQSDA